MRDEDSQLRAEIARWFISRDEVDEAARTLAPGDQLDLGSSDARNLELALERRGLSARREHGHLTVFPGSVAGELTGARRPPARAPAPAPKANVAKKAV